MTFTIDIPKDKIDETFTIGRNGTWRVRGIEVLRGIFTSNCVTLTPIGKNGVLRAGFHIPLETMDQICETWQKYRKSS